MSEREKNSTRSGRLEAFVQTKTPSLNTYLRTHWSKRRKLQSNIGLLIRVAVGCGRPREKFRRVEIIRRSIKALDLDNLWGGCKPFIDSLVGLEFIEDDNPLDVSIDVRQEEVSTPEEEGTLLILSEGLW